MLNKKGNREQKMNLKNLFDRWILRRKERLKQRKKNIMEIANKTAYDIFNEVQDLPERILNRKDKK